MEEYTDAFTFSLDLIDFQNPKIKLRHFEEVYTSKYSMVRVYKIIDPAPRTPLGSYAPELKLGQFKKV